MIENFKPYPAYKDSGVSWLETVPEHWNVRRLCNICEVRISNVDKHTKNDELPVRLCNYKDVYKNDYIQSGMSFMKATAAKNQIEKFQLQPSDVLITKDSETWNDIGVPALVEDSEEDIVCGYHLALLRPLSEVIYGAYLFRALQTSDISSRLCVAANGVTRFGLSRNAIRSLWLPVPPLMEQTIITFFLSQVDRHIRHFINSKQELITLLDKYKQAIIQHAITRGLDPDMNRRPSGMEWLAEVPEHWGVRRLGAAVHRCINGTWGYDSNGIDDLVCVRVADFDRVRHRVHLTNPTLRAITPADRCRRLLKQGDLLLEKSGGGDRQPVGVVVLWDKNLEAVCSNFVARMPIRVGYCSRFVTYLHSHLYAIRLNVRSIKQTTGIQNLDSSSYLNESVAFPPPPEQVEIASFLDQRMAEIGAAIKSNQRQVSLMQEYRTRLISDVVTGKLDVREAAAQLPKQLSETVSVDAAHGPPHMSTGSNRDSDASTEEDEP